MSSALRGYAVRALSVVAWTTTAALPALLFARRSGAFLKTLSMNAEAIGWSLFLAGSTALLLLTWSSGSSVVNLVLLVAGEGTWPAFDFGFGLRRMLGFYRYYSRLRGLWCDYFSCRCRRWWQWQRRRSD